jgi:hypothetical protein
MFMFFQREEYQATNVYELGSSSWILTDMLEMMSVFYYFCKTMEAALKLKLNQYFFDEPGK